ncbi:hypothetical protein CIL05_07020 [Virgibacillus profundi]|uniref:Uncharacterized protein n=1 Tax=Virgibacillus profundi TaxID=2024555 RepID=A0A2A2IDY0_9BACI|nr:hypothetical protein [Virgibacillus profundi]PAV30211.1 hypothetical protein CIL05_07020 [Virgibacillus profundi]PXY54383.1 hypothetical protein CIT14_07105 [Virgibacillus profundi]
MYKHYEFKGTHKANNKPINIHVYIKDNTLTLHAFGQITNYPAIIEKEVIQSLQHDYNLTLITDDQLENVS